MYKIFLIGVLLSALIFSCGDDSTAPEEQKALYDADLILQIQMAANKQSIGKEELPAVSQKVLDKDYSDSYVDDAKVAADLGYEVDLKEELGVRIGDRYQIYFDESGRELRGNKDRDGRGKGDWGGKDRGKDGDRKNTCFKLVYPVIYIMPDGSTITGADAKEVCTAIKEWYEANPGSKERPSLQFPVDIILKDGTQLTIKAQEEMRGLMERCGEWDKDGDKDRERCFKLVFPITYQMPDGSEITVEKREDWIAIKEWYEEHPDSKERPKLQFPVDVMLQDGTMITINNEEEMRGLWERCKEWAGDGDRDRDGEGDGRSRGGNGDHNGNGNRGGNGNGGSRG